MKEHFLFIFNFFCFHLHVCLSVTSIDDPNLNLNAFESIITNNLETFCLKPLIEKSGLQFSKPIVFIQR